MAHDKEERTKIRWVHLKYKGFDQIFRGSVSTLSSIPYDYKEQNPELFQVHRQIIFKSSLININLSIVKFCLVDVPKFTNNILCLAFESAANTCGNLLKVQPILVEPFWMFSQYLWKSFESATNTCGNLLKVQPILVEPFWMFSQYLWKSFESATNTCGNLLKMQPILVKILTSWHDRWAAQLGLVELRNSTAWKVQVSRTQSLLQSVPIQILRDWCTLSHLATGL